jgi:serine protease Do
MNGEVIGINTAIVTATRGFDGVGFAMPSNAAIGVYNQLIKSGRVTRGSIGITFTEANSTNPITLKELGAPYGIIIEEVAAGSPAEKVGLQATDVITSVNGKPVRTGSDLVNPIVATPLGEKVRLSFVRDRKQRDVEVTVEDRAKLFPQASARNAEPDEAPEQAAVSPGLRVESITPEIGRRIGYDGRDGILVTQVEPASFAEDIGFVRMDIIVEVNRVAIASVADFRREMSKLKPGDNVVFRVKRRSQQSDGFLTALLAGVLPENQ